ncbi:hypothetical protein [Rhizobium sp. YTU87027]|uniref:hypothetical protein n=1 Tax=Rhizobium sp. YTU87027 TaxID=3417741 RepID=UPI003D68D452
MSPADFTTAIVTARALDHDSSCGDPAFCILMKTEFTLMVMLTMVLCVLCSPPLI